MKTCNNTDSTLLSAIAEASDAQNSNAASHARRSRRLRHAGDAGKSINGSWRFKLTPALIAILFGILSALLFPSTARSQTVEELQQQISQIQSQISDLQTQKGVLQAENAAYEQEKAELENQMGVLAGNIGQLQSQLSGAVLDAQTEERVELATDLAYYAAVKATLEAQRENLDPESETFQSDFDSISGALQSNNNDIATAEARLGQLDLQYDLAKLSDEVVGAMIGIANGNVAELQQQIDAIQSKIDSNNSSIQEIDAQIDSLQSQINDLQSQIDALNNM